MTPARAVGRCVFCAIATGESDAHIVYEDERSLAFLDHRPLFPGHTLLIPRAHVETLPELPIGDVGPYFQAAQLLARALPEALEVEGTFVAINNGVSQSVRQLHVHVVPRSRGDGLRGFFWPRHPYSGPEEIQALQRRLREAIERLRREGG